jgi:Rrf2 family transcriptional regulator, nitric oxide-sensitive transcriptional repressor
MQLTVFSDYALRTLIYVALKDSPASLNEISSAFNISRNHLSKAVSALEKGGFVKTKRGPGGGIGLPRAPSQINLGDVIRHTEPSFDIVECFDPITNQCKISDLCSLHGVLENAKDAFLHVLSSHSLADIIQNKTALKLRLDGPK